MFPFFAKMKDKCLLTPKIQSLQGVFGRNIALWQQVLVGIGRFPSKWPPARASLALCGRVNCHILESRCGERCANNEFLTSSQATLTFLFESSWKKRKLTPRLCACAVVITLTTQKCGKRHQASSNSTLI